MAAVKNLLIERDSYDPYHDDVPTLLKLKKTSSDVKDQVKRKDEIGPRAPKTKHNY